ncbi:hypothetical protein [Muriicola soli]|uniref:SGNH/GDSL hydrolase family protein n=1 Tax=Muriicola soli TaxID=2507538 RepID=A0A411E823_9FLAO|nr:hypothetical protein [Muriicola soli]QBA63875.1 hypothetical protein EQY75_04580 [Muriicola soli]
MRTFLLKVCIFCLLLFGAYATMLNQLSKGPVDEYYTKFTQKADGLILGLSRADQGIVPKILSDSLVRSDKSFQMVNFAMNQSFYGEIYLNSIRKKLDDKTENGLFILSVNPGAFTAPKEFDDEEIKKFDEKTILGKLKVFTEKPNYDYLSCCYGSSLYNVFFNTSIWDHFVFHEDGWNEVVLNTSRKTITEEDMKHWSELNLRFYKIKLKTEEFKQNRLEYFVKTISLLKDKGEVFLVRMPAAKEILSLENERWDSFDRQMDSIAMHKNVPYLNFIQDSEKYKTYDGSHLYSESARQFTSDLVVRIREKSYKELNKTHF